MKTLNILSIILLVIIFSCSTQIMTNGQNSNFGINEVLKNKDVPVQVMESIKAGNVRLEENEDSPVIGYISKADTSVLQHDFSGENIKLLRTVNTVDSEQEEYAISAVRPMPVMNIHDVKTTAVNGEGVFIKFNRNSTKKWADVTQKNVGNYLAFVIHDQIYSIPRVNAQIKRGKALIVGFKNNQAATETSDALNAMIKE